MKSQESGFAAAVSDKKQNHTTLWYISVPLVTGVGEKKGKKEKLFTSNDIIAGNGRERLTIESKIIEFLK